MAKKQNLIVRNKDLDAGVPPSSENPGAFGAKRQEESGLSLASALEGVTDERLAGLHDLALRSARRGVAKRGTGMAANMSEDVASESMAQFLTAVKNRGGLPENPEGYLSRIVSHEVSAATATVSKGARSGWFALNKRVREAESALGRPLSGEEIAQEGEALIAANPGKYPREFWLEKNRAALPLSLVMEETGETGDMRNAFDVSDDIDLDEQIDWNDLSGERPFSKALLSLADDNRTAQTHAFRYNAAAELSGAPRAVPGSLSRRQEVNAYTTMHVSDDEVVLNEKILSAVSAWEEGEESPTTKHLFAPFADTDNAQKSAVTDMFRDNPRQAWMLWHSALTAANRQNHDRIMKVLWDENPSFRVSAHNKVPA